MVAAEGGRALADDTEASLTHAHPSFLKLKFCFGFSWIGCFQAITDTEYLGKRTSVQLSLPTKNEASRLDPPLMHQTGSGHVVGNEEKNGREREEDQLEQEVATSGIQTVPPDYLLIPLVLFTFFSGCSSPGKFSSLCRREREKSKAREKRSQNTSNCFQF